MPNAASLTYWYLQIPSVMLLAMIVLLCARLVTSLAIDERLGIMRPVIAITQPVVVAVGAITPRIVPAAGVIICAIVWLLAVRVVLFMIALALGVRL